MRPSQLVLQILVLQFQFVHSNVQGLRLKSFLVFPWALSLLKLGQEALLSLLHLIGHLFDLLVLLLSQFLFSLKFLFHHFVLALQLLEVLNLLLEHDVLPLFVHIF